MKTVYGGLTWILTIIFFASVALYQSALNYKEKVSAIQAANEILTNQKIEEKANKTMTLEVAHDSDPNTNTCPVIISASNSIDLDGDSFFKWNQIDGDMVDLGESANSSVAQFDAQAGEYTFVVSISDPYLETCVDTVFVSIAEEANNCPVPVIQK